MIKLETILRRMMSELEAANNKTSKDVKKHVERIRVLCDLILDEDDINVTQSEQPFTADEMKTMIGSNQSIRSPHINEQKQSHVQADDDQGDSLFDF